VIIAGISGTAINVAVPRVLGHATDLLFSGMLGHQLPAGLSQEQAISAARKRGDTGLADVLSGMAVVPGQGVNFSAVERTLMLALTLYLVAALLIWVQLRVLNVAVQRTLRTLRFAIADKLHRLPLAYFDGQQRGELLSRITNDIDNLQTSLSLTVSQLLSTVLTVATVAVMMFTISPMLAAITLATIPPSLLATRAITRRSQRLFTAQWARTGRLNAHIEETYSGFTLVKTFGHRITAQQQFRQLNDEMYQASFGAQFVSGLLSPITTFIGNLGYVAVAVIGGVQVATGQLTVGSVQAFIHYMRQFNQPLTQVASMYNTLQSGLASAERVFEVLDEPEEPSSVALAPAWVTPSASQACRVEFHQVNFSYHPGTPVIRDLSLVIEPGTTMAIVGPTGAGKTTLVNLLMRFYDVDSGRILIDGVDITAMSRQSLRSRMAMVLQDTWLFTGTIAQNIGYGQPSASQDELLHAAKAAHVDQFVRALPDSYQTQISNDGNNLSTGEKQLITIARAALANRQLLILDEATSSVDTLTETRIAHAMRELRQGRTSLVVAHRLSTIREADQIAVMQAGTIVERGSHSELLAHHGMYYQMTRS
ncbi:MAG: ABC transporter ATP-binding protein/permease, partial [Mycobacteriaceae bacterium]|nr:ABC transporter ATP-binding protein/permease [Mycobacteriaceae bacterium]